MQAAYRRRFSFGQEEGTLGLFHILTPRAGWHISLSLLVVSVSIARFGPNQSPTDCKIMGLFGAAVGSCDVKVGDFIFPR